MKKDFNKFPEITPEFREEYKLVFQLIDEEIKNQTWKPTYPDGIKANIEYVKYWNLDKLKKFR